MNGETRDVAGVTAKFGVPPTAHRRLPDAGRRHGRQRARRRQGRPEDGRQVAAEYGSLDGVVAAADRIKGAVGENLRKALDWLPQGRAAGHRRHRLRPVGTCAGLAGARRAGLGAKSTATRCWTFYEPLRLQGLSSAGGGRTCRPTPIAQNRGQGTGASTGASDDRSLRRGWGCRAAYDTILTREHFDALAGEAASRAAGRARHRDHLARRDARAHRRHLASAWSRARRPTSRWRHNYPDAPDAAAAWTRCWRRLKPWLEDAAQPEARPAHQVRPPRVRQPRHRGAGLRARHACCKATCSKCTSRTAWPAWPSATWAAAA